MPGFIALVDTDDQTGHVRQATFPDNGGSFSGRRLEVHVCRGLIELTTDGATVGLTRDSARALRDVLIKILDEQTK